MRTKSLVAASALLLFAATLPSTHALETRLELPLAAVVLIEVPEESPDARPRTTVAPGWSCVETQPWFRQGDLAAIELECTPTTETTVVEWTCRNPVVYAEGYGLGTVTGTAYCDGVSVSCTAAIVGYNSCSAITFASGTPPLRCRADVTGFVAPWSVVCHNDP